MEVYVGMDVHRKRSQIAVLDQHGGQVLNRNLPNDPAELLPVLGRLAPGTPVAFEAAYGWGWLVDLLDGLGLEPHLVHPSRCKAIASARLKDDKVDARTLATCSAPTCCPRPGSPHRQSATSAPCCATESPWYRSPPQPATGYMPCSPTAASAWSSGCGQLTAESGSRRWT